MPVGPIKTEGRVMSAEVRFRLPDKGGYSTEIVLVAWRPSCSRNTSIRICPCRFDGKCVENRPRLHGNRVWDQMAVFCQLQAFIDSVELEISLRLLSLRLHRENSIFGDPSLEQLTMKVRQNTAPEPETTSSFRDDTNTLFFCRH